MDIQPPKDKAERDARLDLVLKTIEENPQHWKQHVIGHSGACHCAGGIVECLAKGVPIEDVWLESRYTFVKTAKAWLGDGIAFTFFFDVTNTIKDLRAIVSEIKQTPYTPLEPSK